MKKAIYAMVEGDCDEVRTVDLIIFYSCSLVHSENIKSQKDTFCGFISDRHTYTSCVFTHKETPAPPPNPARVCDVLVIPGTKTHEITAIHYYNWFWLQASVCTNQGLNVKDRFSLPVPSLISVGR